MSNLIAGLIIGVFGTLTAVCMLLAFALFGGTLVYFLWNYLAPVYFATFLPALYLHLPWWHCVCFLWLLGLINPFKSNVSVEAK
jgi:hypothetical protein